MFIRQEGISFISDRYTLRRIQAGDAQALARVYASHQAQGYIYEGEKADIATAAAMECCVQAWCDACTAGDRICWTIWAGRRAAGTAEMRIHRAEDAWQGAAVLRIDLGNDQEFEDVLDELLCTMLPWLFEVCNCRCILTRAASFMGRRQRALAGHGFRPAEQPITGADGRMHTDYWVLRV